MRDSLRLFNTLSGKKERFRPMRPREVSMFVCGPTVQSMMHLGHARTYVFFDTVARYLEHVGYEVTYVMNITDLDESITRAALQENESPAVLARRFYRAFLEDMTSLRCTSVSRYEPVSLHVGTMIQEVTALLGAGKAYIADGWVYFDTSKFRSFGRLSGLSSKEIYLRPLELSTRKRHLPDFALWRREELIRGKWRSPWGVGSPGWHIQDTAVTLSLLGMKYDIHGGAFELVYPHHEAQIAQTESLTGLHPTVKYWIHTHHLVSRGRKMSKSLGNVMTVRDALARNSASELRLFLLSKHYRREMDLKGVDDASRQLRRLHRIASIMQSDPQANGRLESYTISPFEAAMNDDFDTPRAISWVERTLAKGQAETDRVKRKAAFDAATRALDILGVDLFDST